MDVIKFYSGLKNGYETFSNFYKAPFCLTIDNERLTFLTVEHYFHYQKARLFDDKNVQDAILKEKNPLTVKRLGRTVKNFNPIAWNKVAQKHLKNGMYLKFTQNPKLKTQLLATGDAMLCEANPYDSVYGIGRNGTGRNLTGICLMCVRDII